MDWPHSGTVMHYSRYLYPQDGAMSVILSSQQEAALSVLCVQEGSCLQAAEIENVTV
jgi:hypothetical protein